MRKQYVDLDEIVDKFNLNILNEVDTRDIKIVSPDLNRIGLQLTGYLHHFANERIQIVGNVEWGFMQTLEPAILKQRISAIMATGIPCIMFARNLAVDPMILRLGEEYGVPIYQTKRQTTAFIASLLKYIDAQLAPSTSLHAVLLDISGIGTLIMGKSGIGKSEIALELVKRGHRFVADDSVEITKFSDGTLVGRSPELIKNLLEIRGIGIVDMSKLYGIGSVRDNMKIDLVVRIENWNEGNDYDRIGSAEHYYNILDTEVPLLILPVSPGRNLAVILEAAVRNQALKRMGYDALVELDERIKLKNQAKSKR